MSESETPKADWVVESLADDETEIIQIDGHDNAILGYTDCIANGYAHRLVYSRDKILENLVERDGMEYDEAVEFFDFNIVQAYVGEITPLIITDIPAGIGEEESTVSP